MEPMEVLKLVRLGYACATPDQIALVSRCPEAAVIDEVWVPRWALEAQHAFEAAGYSRWRIGLVFAEGHDAVLAELGSLVSAGLRRRILEPRLPWSPLPFDRPTQEALSRALQTHRSVCSRCAADLRCPEAQKIREELDLLFPMERRSHPRA